MSEIKQSSESATTLTAIDPNNLQETMFNHSWRPWEHIYAMARPGKGVGVNYPQFNPYGKYVVKLYWMASDRNFKLFTIVKRYIFEILGIELNIPFCLTWTFANGLLLLV